MWYGEYGFRCGGVQRGIDRVGAAEERLLVAREDRGSRGALGFASHLASLWDSRQAPRQGRRQCVCFFLSLSRVFPFSLSLVSPV